MNDQTNTQTSTPQKSDDSVTLNDVLLDQTKILAEEAALRTEQLAQMKQDLDDLKTKYSKSNEVSEVEAPVVIPVPTIPVNENPGFGGQQYNAASQPSAFPPVASEVPQTQ